MRPTTPSCDVVVVGAGVAGLVAAHALSRTGRTVTCFEARDRVGGRALSVEHSGLTIDLGATWFWHNEPLVVTTLDQLELESFPQAVVGDALFEATDLPPQRLDGNPIDTPSQRFTTGAQSLPAGLAADLPRGVLHLGDPVHRIRQDDHRILVDAARGTVTADHVIVAVPPALAVEAITFTPDLPAPLHQVASDTVVWMGDTIKAVAVFDVPFWRAEGLAGTAFSYRGPFREFHDHSGPNGGAGAIFGFAPAAAGAATVDIADVFRAQLARLFGEHAYGPREIIVMDWANERHTTPTQRSPGASTAGFGHRFFQEAAAGGRIHWASTETDDAYAGHVEGALRAGMRAARAVEASLGGP